MSAKDDYEGYFNLGFDKGFKAGCDISTSAECNIISEKINTLIRAIRLADKFNPDGNDEYFLRSIMKDVIRSFLPDTSLEDDNGKGEKKS